MGYKQRTNEYVVRLISAKKKRGVTYGTFVIETFVDQPYFVR